MSANSLHEGDKSMRYYNKPINEVLRYLKVNSEVGLDEKEIEERRKKYGQNEFTIKAQKSFFAVFFVVDI